MDGVNEDGGPAFPVKIEIDEEVFDQCPGMTLRDFLAAKALPVAAEAMAFGLRADDHNPQYTYEDETDADMLAEGAYCIADAMLRFRKVKIQ